MSAIAIAATRHNRPSSRSSRDSGKSLSCTAWLSPRGRCRQDPCKRWANRRL